MAIQHNTTVDISSVCKYTSKQSRIKINNEHLRRLDGIIRRLLLITVLTYNLRNVRTTLGANFIPRRISFQLCKYVLV